MSQESMPLGAKVGREDRKVRNSVKMKLIHVHVHIYINQYVASFPYFFNLYLAEIFTMDMMRNAFKKIKQDNDEIEQQEEEEQVEQQEQVQQEEAPLPPKKKFLSKRRQMMQLKKRKNDWVLN